MKRLLTLSIFLSLNIFSNTSTWANTKTLIVSDIDDTIKATDVLGKKAGIIINALIRKTAFAGMSELYRELDNDQTKIYYLSGSPKDLYFRVERFLNYNFFPQAEHIILRGSLLEDIRFYKFEALKSLILRINPKEITLIGDDTESDPEVFQDIAKLYPERVKNIYIRVIQKRALPDNKLIKSFFSPLEIAGHEMLNNNFTTTALARVAKGYIKQPQSSVLAIAKRYCPKEGREEIEEIAAQLTDPSAIEILNDGQIKIITTCTAR